jgi:hypothetical protein
MSKPGALTLVCCLAALPLIDCANGVGPQSQAYPTAAPVVANTDGARLYATGPGGPAAILVMLPAPGDSLTADPALWAAQGFDVVTPPPGEIYRLAADREAAFERLISSARAMADMPVWLVGANRAIEAALAGTPLAGPGQVSGIVVTSVTSNAGSCSERMTYSYAGNGTAPKITVSKLGEACPAGSPFDAGRSPAVVPRPPAARPTEPRVIEASTMPDSGSLAANAALVQHLATVIKASPSS